MYGIKPIEWILGSLIIVFLVVLQIYMAYAF